MISVCIFGRPSVGKSTLFNKLISRNHRSITSATPGTTRDIKRHQASIGDLSFHLLDTPGLETDVISSANKRNAEFKDKIITHINSIQKTPCAQKKHNQLLNKLAGINAITTIEESDVLLFVVDDVLTADDYEVASYLAKIGKNVVLVVNKCDRKIDQYIYYELGHGEPVYISAEHSIGFAQLYERLALFAQQEQEVEPSAHSALKLCIAGRPNSGKSTYVNALLGSDKMLVSIIAGTTRDSIQSSIFYMQQEIVLIDTAGLRRKSKITDSIEKLSSIQAIKSTEQADAVLLFIDAQEGICDQDLKVANLILERNKILVLVVNKWDLIRDKKTYMDEMNYLCEKHLSQAKGINVVYISSIKKKDIYKPIDLALEIYKLSHQTIPTSKINRWLQSAMVGLATPSDNGRRIKLKYATQCSTNPIRIKIFGNMTSCLPDHYKRYLINHFRSFFNMHGANVVLDFVEQHNPYKR